MIRIRILAILITTTLSLPICSAALGDELIPPLSQIRRERPRLLLRPHSSPFAVSLEELRDAGEGSAYEKLLAQLAEQENAAARAMLWLLTGDSLAADWAMDRM